MQRSMLEQSSMSRCILHPTGAETMSIVLYIYGVAEFFWSDAHWGNDGPCAYFEMRNSECVWMVPPIGYDH